MIYCLILLGSKQKSTDNHASVNLKSVGGLKVAYFSYLLSYGHCQQDCISARVSAKNKAGPATQPGRIFFSLKASGAELV